MSKHDLLERFMSVAVPKLGRDGSERVVKLVAHLETLRDVRELTLLLRTPA